MLKRTFILACACIAAVLPANAAEWITDFEAAKAKAKAENKTVLVDFTGSDWCHFCIVLRRRVLDTPAFEAWGADKFVYLEVDLPRRTRLPEALLAQNNALVKQYRVGGFPTVLVLDAEGHALGGFTGGMTRLADVQKALQPALQVHRLMQAAANSQAPARAAYMAQAYAAYPDNYRRFNTWLRERLEQEDPADTTGWRTTYAAELQMEVLEAELTRYVMNRADMLACYDRYLAEAVPGNRPRILRLKDHYLTGLASIKLQHARTVEDILEARNLQIQAADCAEEPGERAERIRRVHEVYADPAAMLQDMKGRYRRR